jgi:hypothetical protein
MPQALAALATVLAIAPHGNRIELQLDHGAAELTWLTPSTFHFRRTLDGPLAPGKPPTSETVALDIDDTPGALRLRSKFLEVTIRKRGVLVRARGLDGTVLMNDATEPEPSGAGIAWERELLPAARYYGLGPRSDPAFDLRTKVQPTTVPFLYSTAGFGEFHVPAGAYRFDFSVAGRYRIHAPNVDYLFYYGPTIKQVMEEHRAAQGPPALWNAAADRFGSWAGLRAALLRIVHGSISAMLAPTFDLKPYDSAPPELAERARQLGSLVAEVTPGRRGVSDFRSQLENFFTVYSFEAHEKGFPVWHPLPFQFPDDPECARHADEFMLGDEMLVAPIVEPGNQRSLYLPQGIWTNLETNEVFPGRRTIAVETATLPVFARNGTIVPLDSPSGMALHYFPKLGAEFFLAEDDAPAWTQVHAAPAAEIMRLEIESKKARDYEWVVHHVDRPAEVGFDGTQWRELAAAPMADRTWAYDALKRDLRIRVRVAAGEDSIVNIR